MDLFWKFRTLWNFKILISQIRFMISNKNPENPGSKFLGNLKILKNWSWFVYLFSICLSLSSIGGRKRRDNMLIFFVSACGLIASALIFKRMYYNYRLLFDNNEEQKTNPSNMSDINREEILRLGLLMFILIPFKHMNIWVIYKHIKVKGISSNMPYAKTDKNYRRPFRAWILFGCFLEKSGSWPVFQQLNHRGKFSILFLCLRVIYPQI